MPRIVVVSDTHGKHEDVIVPPCDILVHAGDYSRRGSRDDAASFLAWIDRAPAKHVVFVSGNHDFFSERQKDEMAALVAKTRALHLVDATVELEGLTIHGSPVTPWFRAMAWNRPRGAGMSEHYRLVPEHVDLLVTHGPPAGRLDRTFFGANVGCEVLREVVAERRPRVHVFGHIHEAAGEHDDGITRSINAATSRLVFGTRPARVIDVDAR